MTEPGLLARAVEEARLAAGWGKEEAARQAGISSITWSRVEQGLGVREEKLAAIERALGWPRGRIRLLAAGIDPDEDADFVSAPGPHRNDGTATNEEVLLAIREMRQRVDELAEKVDRITGGQP